MALGSLAALLPAAAARSLRCTMATPSSSAGLAPSPARVGVVQMTSVGDLDANYATCSRLAKGEDGDDGDIESVELPSNVVESN